jgi:hypothetical protein
VKDYGCPNIFVRKRYQLTVCQSFKIVLVASTSAVAERLALGRRRVVEVALLEGAAVANLSINYFVVEREGVEAI